MTAKSLYRAFAQLSTPLVADAALRLEISFRISPPGIRPITPNQCLAGPALPVRHSGSVDVFLEAMQGARPGDVLVIDNDGRSLREQLDFVQYLEKRAANPGYTFREHLPRISGAIEG